MSEQEAVPLEINEVLGRALQALVIPAEPVGNGFYWQTYPVDMPDGKKSVAAILAITRGNGIELYWFGPNDMQKFANGTMQTLQVQRDQSAALNPLVVADSRQMSDVIASQENRRNIEWPRKGS